MSDKPPKQPSLQRGATGGNNIFSVPSDIRRFLRHRNGLNEQQRNAVELLLHGMSDQEVAAQLRLDRTTVFRWRKSLAFQRELERQRRRLWEQSAGEIQSMVRPALSILRKQLSGEDPKLAMRAAGVLLRFATPSRLLPASVAGKVVDEHKQFEDDLIAYVEAPPPGQPGAPEDMTDEEDDEST